MFRSFLQALSTNLKNEGIYDIVRTVAVATLTIVFNTFISVITAK